MRTKLVTGNWKMNLDLKSARGLVAELRELLPAEAAERGGVEVALAPAFPYLFPIAKAIDGTSLRLAAQNLYHETSGAFTGEVSAEMIRDTGARFVIIGHSERRHTIGHHEDDRMINLKVHAALRAALTPILCIGETLQERERDQTREVLTYQVSAGLTGVSVSSGENLVIAYEPVWAIGTGRNATPEQAQEAHAHIRTVLAGISGIPASSIRILYGGSVKPDNAGVIFGQADVDGGLIGGASLQAASFAAIVRAAMATAQR